VHFWAPDVAIAMAVASGAFSGNFVVSSLLLARMLYNNVAKWKYEYSYFI